VVVSDVIAETDTSLHAHVRLPALGWGEKDGTVTNSERRISRQRPFLAAPGEARPDWWIIGEVGRRMGWKTAFAFDGPADIYREHARLSAYQNDGRRLFDLRAHAAIGNADYDALEPFRWGGAAFADGRYSTPDGKARLVAVAQGPLADPLKDWPLTLNTGRYRDQWHTMTRTGLSPKLARHREEPLVEVHPDDAATYDLTDGGLARVATAQGESLFRVAVTDRQRRGELFTPIHWTDRQSTGGRTGLLPRPLVDPHSGQPGFKLTPARIEKIDCAWRGFLLVRGSDTPPPKCLWRTRVTVPGGLLYELAGNGDPARLGACLPKGAQIEARDASRGSWRVAVIDKARLAAALFVTATGELPPRDWLIAQLEAPEVAPTLLAGRAPGAAADRGPIVCVCFDVGMRTILSAIAAQKLTDVAAVGKALNAGTNCGSCRPAIANLIAQSELAHAS
jgi:assimilatory nitrate reductase catalytic subunit